MENNPITPGKYQWSRTLSHNESGDILVRMSTPASPVLRRKVRRLTGLCLILWLVATVMPVLMAGSAITLGPWPLDFWMAAQGSVLVYLLIVCLYTYWVNRWEREADALSFEVSTDQDV